MTGQQTLHRKKLIPKHPSKVFKKNKTTAPFNRRAYELTTHQQSWARSLTASLSGWRTRQAFLKAQLEAHLKAEAECEVQEAARQAAIQAEEDARLAKLQAEAAIESARKAAAWEKADSETHEAGIEDKTEEEIDEEEYMYHYINRLHDRRYNAKTKHDRDDDNADETELNTSSPDIPSPPKIQPAPTASLVAKADWRVKARAGIMKKKLTIDKGWSAVTWNQKSNVQERLLLLEEDGYDITELQERKASSEEITAIILERAAAQKAPGRISTSSKSRSGTPLISSENVVSSPVQRRDAAGEWLSPVPSACPALPKSELIPTQLDVQVRRPQPSMNRVIQDDTQPFSLDAPYQPQASPPLKRKRDSISVASTTMPKELEDSDAEYPVRKKRNITFQTETSLQIQALQEIKAKILRRIFRPALSVWRPSTPPSRIAFYTAAPRLKPREGASISTIEYLYPKQPTAPPAIVPLYINPAGYTNIISELRFLTDTTNPTTISNPDLDGEEIESSARTGSEIETVQRKTKKKLHDQYRQHHRISISNDERGRVVLCGDTRILAELCRALQDHEMLHCVKWKWDGLRLRPEKGLRWSLGPSTQGVLLELGRRLEWYAVKGGVEVCVGVC